MKVNEKIFKSLKFNLEALKEELMLNIELLEKAKKEGDLEKVKTLESEILNIQEKINETRADLAEYKNRHDQVIAAMNIGEKEKLSQYKSEFREYEDSLSGKYLGENKEKKKNARKPVIKAVALALAIVAAFGIGRCSKDKGNSQDINVPAITQPLEKTPSPTEVAQVTPEPTQEVVENLGEPGTFTDASNEEQVIARAQWYFKEYFDKEFEKLSLKGKVTANPETLADAIAVVNGEYPIYKEFNTNDVLAYNNDLVQLFASYLMLDKDTQKAGYVPHQYLYEDGSYEQKCAAELDEIMIPLVEAINKEDNESFIKYATAYGELMKKHYLHLDFTDDSYNVRGMAAFPSKIHLYSNAYAEYTNKIMTYQLDHNIDICIPICVDHTTQKYVDYSLSKLMATLEFIPMMQWDAVIARSGLSVEQLEKLGNKSTEETMPEAFTEDAKDHFREKVISQNNILKLK